MQMERTMTTTMNGRPMIVQIVKQDTVEYSEDDLRSRVIRFTFLLFFSR